MKFFPEYSTASEAEGVLILSSPIYAVLIAFLFALLGFEGIAGLCSVIAIALSLMIAIVTTPIIWDHYCVPYIEMAAEIRNKREE